MNAVADPRVDDACGFGAFTPPRPATTLVAPTEGTLLPALGQRYLNGTVVDVRDASNRPRRILVLTHYLTPHRTHQGAVPSGYTVERIVHRGEYELREGTFVAVNSSSGDAKREGAANDIAPVEAFLTGSALTTTATRFQRFDERSPHLYAGFNEPGGPPPGLHELRKRVHAAFTHSLFFLNSDDPGHLAANPRLPRAILDHWSIFATDMSPADARTARRYLTLLANGFVPENTAEVLPMLNAIERRMQRVQVITLD